MAATAQSNVEIVEQLYEAFNRGDIETCLAGFAEDITWTEPEGSPQASGTYHSPDAVLKNVFEPAFERFESFEVAADRFIDGGDTVVVEGVFRSTLPGGNTMEVPYAHVIDLEDGKVQRFTNYEDTALDQQLMEE
ncbi:nuclear transport factor 2 family protein [Halomontanus rarus]|uniref:nuclear transport factor 2 family protein n=1 Tax=Halomontanus rarus TaxID=3034020 RepID=UPI001A99C953